MCRLIDVSKTVILSGALLWLSLPGASLRGDESPAAKAGNHNFELQTAFLHEKLEGAHRIQISGEIDGSGNTTGKGTLRRDPNTCRINQLGDTVACTLIGFPDDEVVLTPVKIPDPTGAGRMVYSIDGAKLAGKLYLVYSPKSEAASRLVSETGAGIQRVVTLEPVPKRKIVDPNAEPKPAPPSGNAPPGGAGKPLGVADYHAWQASGVVILVAEGTSNTAGHKVYFQQLPIRIFPPQYRLHDEPPAGPAAQVITPFRVAATFRAADPVAAVVVHDAKGRHDVPVKAVGTAVDVPKQGDHQRPTAIQTGISKRLSLDEAISDAAGKLKAPRPDALIRFKVIEIQGEVGGIAGKRELSVKIEATTE